ncbi:hypothetical protein AB4254_11040 [Vibrio breoganii]
MTRKATTIERSNAAYSTVLAYQTYSGIQKPDNKVMADHMDIFIPELAKDLKVLADEYDIDIIEIMQCMKTETEDTAELEA